MTTQTINVRMTPAEGAFVRLLGLIGRRGFEVRSVSASRSDCGSFFHIVLSIVGERPFGCLQANISKMYDVLEVAVPQPAGVPVPVHAGVHCHGAD